MTFKRRALRAAVVLVVLASAVVIYHYFRAVQPVEKGPNILLISIDTLRADHLGCYGYSQPTSPRIDELARRGLVFTDCSAESSWTLPTMATLLSGLPTEVHGVRHVAQRVADPIELVAQRLRANGYRTGAAVCGPALDASFGFDRGFESYQNSLPWPRDSDTAPIARGSHAEETTDTAIRWLERLGSGDRFFLLLHYRDPHADYDAPEPYKTRFDPDYKGTLSFDDVTGNTAINPDMNPRDRKHLIARYDGEIAYTDAQVGRLLDWLEGRGLLDDTLVVITGSHGEEFFEHGHKGHGETLYREATHVPLIVVPPGGRQGKRISIAVGSVDVAPTLLGAAKVAHDLPGRDLMARRIEPRLVVSELGNIQRAVRHGRLHAIERHNSARWELYDLEVDPQEIRDLARTDPEGLDTIKELLLERRKAWSLLRIDRFPTLDPTHPTMGSSSVKIPGYR